MVKIEEVDGWKDCPKSQMVAGLDSQDCHHPRRWLKKRNLEEVDGGRWGKLMVWEEEVDGWKDCPKSQMVAGLDSQDCHHPRWRLKN